MYWKCNTHLLELNEAVSRLFNTLADKLDTPIVLESHARWKVPNISDNSTIGEQIKFYRRQANLKQVDICSKLGFGRDVLLHIENDTMTHIDINRLNDIIKELGIENKIKINDDYILFILNNPSAKLKLFRKKMGFTQKKLAQLLDVDRNTVYKWEKGSQMSKTSYFTLKELMFKLDNKSEWVEEKYISAILSFGGLTRSKTWL